MQLQHYADVPWRSIDFSREILNALRSGDLSRLTELQFISACLAGDDELADFIATL